MTDATIFGMGYVGTVVAVGLARHGKRIAGVEVSAAKRAAFAAGRIPFREPGLEEAFSACRDRIAIHPTVEAAGPAPIALICVGTPRDPATGACDPTAVLGCLRQIAAAASDPPPLVLIRSTLWPGLWDDCREVAGDRVRLGVQPEFMREGSALSDFENPTLHVAGVDDAGDVETIARLYDFISQKPAHVSPKLALLLKYACNSFHGLKIAFTNEMAATAARLDVDGQALMELFRRDDRLNASAAYLRPGLPFGGSCLPKDLSQLETWAAEQEIALPILRGVLASNQAHLNRTVDAAARFRKVAIVGLTFKPGVDDLRGSPLVELIRGLAKKGVTVVGIDENLKADRLVDVNRALFEELTKLKHFSMRDAFAGDEGAVFFSFDTPQTRALVPKVPKGTPAFSFFRPPEDLPLTEFVP